MLSSGPIAAPSDTALWTRRTVIALLALLAFRLIALYATGLELFYDEAQYWAWSRHLDFGYFSKPGMVAWLIAGTTAVCGDGAACVRLSAPLVHALTAFAVFALGARLYDARVGFWSALGYALMPAVSLSSLLITTDVPLLLFWTLGLLAGHRLIAAPSAGTAVAYGLAVALGLNAKYAMAYLPLLSFLYVLVDARRRAVLASPWPWIAMVIGVLGFVPNLVWNASHGFVTFDHTGGNTGLAEASLHAGKALEFLGSQFGIAGPVILVVAAIMLTGRLQSARPDADRYLLWHSVPVIATVAANAVFGKMNANWAATAYPGLLVAATAALVDGGWRRTLRLSLGIGLVAALAIGAGTPAFHFVDPPKFIAQARKMVHWQSFGDTLAEAAGDTDLDTIVMVGRELSAQGVYLLSDRGFTVRSYTPVGQAPDDHFQMTMPWRPGEAAPVLLVTAGDIADLDLGGYQVRKLADLPARLHFAAAGTVPLYRLDPRPSATAEPPAQ